MHRLLLAALGAAILTGVVGFVLIRGKAPVAPPTTQPDQPKPDVAPPKPPEILTIVPQVLGNFEYKQKMELSADVMKWNNKRVKISGYINPTQQAQGITSFLLVKDRSACCFGKRPQINHYIDVTLKKDKLNYSQDPVTIVGTLKIEDRWDGDWQMGLYWIDDGEISH